MPEATSPIISVRNLVNRFGAQIVHDGINLDVLPGEVLGIVGGSGSGKSVLLRTMLGLHRPTSGEVMVEGRDITQLSGPEMLEVKRRYGVTFQHGALFSSLTVAREHPAADPRVFRRLARNAGRIDRAAPAHGGIAERCRRRSCPRSCRAA